MSRPADDGIEAAVGAAVGGLPGVAEVRRVVARDGAVEVHVAAALGTDLLALGDLARRAVPGEDVHVVVDAVVGRERA